jgi:hypothetical protein
MEMDTMNRATAPILNTPEATVVNGKVEAAQATALGGEFNSPGSFQLLGQGVQMLGDAVKELVGILQRTPR